MKLNDIKKHPTNIESSKNVREVSIQELFSQFNLAKIPIILDGGEYIIDIEDLIRLGNPSELSDNQIEEIVERITATRVTFAVAEADGISLLSDLQSEFDKWFSSKAKPIVDRFGRISDDKILHEILSNPDDADLYLSKKKLLSLLVKNNTKLKSLQWILNQRVSILESILDRRFTIKRGRGKDSGI